MADGLICDRCQSRPAAATVRQVTAGRRAIVRNLCQRCLAEGRVAPPGATRRGLFDEFLSQLAGQQPHEGTGVPVGVPQPVQQTDITRFFSDATRQLLQRAAYGVVERGGLELDADHLLLGALGDDGVRRLLTSIDADPDELARELDQHLQHRERTDISPELSPTAKRTLLTAYQEARQLGHDYVGPEHVLLALTTDDESSAGRLLTRYGISHVKLRGAVIRGARTGEDDQEASTTPTVDQHSRDLTALAREGRLDPVVGRNDEIDQTIEILSRRTKNNPVLIGDPGVGKTAVVEGIAQRIVNGDVPETLEGKRLLNLDLGGLIAGTRHRGEFEERLKGILDEIQRSQDTMLLFIDELHTLVGAGAAEGAMDAANMLKPALARGELHVIGATTLDEYRKNIEKDAALERRFQPVVVDEPSLDETIQILFGLKDRYEAFHRVRITDEAITAAAELSDRYVTDRFLPDKAIDLIDQAGARVRLRHATRSQDMRALEEEIAELEREKHQAVAAEEYERAGELRAEIAERREAFDSGRDHRRATAEVTAEDIAEIVSRATGIPVSQLTQEERDRLLHLEDRIHERVIGQDEAVASVAEAVRRSRAGLGDPDRPIGSFLFLGPTGVGKTELARTLAAGLFGDEDHMLRLDMSEYQERHTVSRLVGAPPGYVGHEEAGQLTERIRRRPYSVILLDEIEKAHPDVFNLLLQILDDGRLTDSQGRTVDFTNTVVVMTSNLGAERIQGSRRPRVGFAPESSADGAEAEYERLKGDLMEVLRGHFRPEFLNRIDDIVVFRALERAQLLAITRLLADRMVRRMAAQEIDVQLTEAALEHLADVGFDPDFGARPLRRAIQREVENELSRLVLEGSVDSGDKLTVDVHGGGLAFVVDRGGNGNEEFDNWEAPPTREHATTAGPAAPRR